MLWFAFALHDRDETWVVSGRSVSATTHWNISHILFAGYWPKKKFYFYNQVAFFTERHDFKQLINFWVIIIDISWQRVTPLHHFLRSICSIITSEGLCLPAYARLRLMFLRACVLKTEQGGGGEACSLYRCTARAGIPVGSGKSFST